MALRRGQTAGVHVAPDRKPCCYACHRPEPKWPWQRAPAPPAGCCPHRPPTTSMAAHAWLRAPSPCPLQRQPWPVLPVQGKRPVLLPQVCVPARAQPPAQPARQLPPGSGLACPPCMRRTAAAPPLTRWHTACPGACRRRLVGRGGDWILCHQGWQVQSLVSGWTHERTPPPLRPLHAHTLGRSSPFCASAGMHGSSRCMLLPLPPCLARRRSHCPRLSLTHCPAPAPCASCRAAPSRTACSARA